ncbi:MAG: peptidase M64 N-terminal domain-containing protein, partial [Candidatus Aminicenantes bacterium]
MKKIHYLIALILLFSGTLLAQEKPDFDDYFVDKTMRVDYFHIGDAKEETITIDQVYEQGIWAGSKQNLIDRLNYGRYCIKIYDSSSGKLVYAKGFDSYFGEYKTTGKALEGIKRTYHESFLLPYPKKTIRFSFEARNRRNELYTLFTQEIDPFSVDILKERLDKGVKVFELWKTGDPHVKVDLAFIAEGYRIDEEPKLESDLRRFMGVFFEQEPYKSLKDEFNLYGVFKPSQESGCDEPRHGVFKNTAVDATFNSLGSERYLLTEDNKSLRDIAAHVPYDTLVIMINQDRYGGG